MSFVLCVPSWVGTDPFQPRTHLHIPRLWNVGTSHTNSLTHYIIHTLATDRVILLASVWNHGQGITLWSTAGTPTPNGLRSNWDFLPGRSPWHVGGSNTINQCMGCHPPKSILVSPCVGCDNHLHYVVATIFGCVGVHSLSPLISFSCIGGILHCKHSFATQVIFVSFVFLCVSVKSVISLQSCT